MTAKSVRYVIGKLHFEICVYYRRAKILILPLYHFCHLIKNMYMRKIQKISLTRIWRPCHVCGHRVPRRPQPQLPPRERVVAAEEEAVDIADVLGPYLPGVGCDGDREHHGYYHVDRIVLHLHRHHRPRGNPRAARHHRTAITKL